MPTQGSPLPDGSDPKTVQPTRADGVVGRVAGSSLIAELRRRRVPQVVASYGMISWGLVQLATTVVPLLNLPAWTPRAVLILLLAGFPLTILLAWTFDITPEGLRRAAHHPDAAPLPVNPVWRILWLVISIAMVAGGIWLVTVRPEPTDAPNKSSALALGGFAVKPDEGSLAVMPFDNITSDSTAEYFADGITDDIITALAKIGKLRVTSRMSVMQYKGARRNLRDVARELGVKSIIEGSVRREGNQVRISVQLIDAETDRYVWAETYDRELHDVFAIQSEIARRVAAALNAEVAPGEVAQLAKAPTVNVSAYDLFLQARDLELKNRPEEREHITSLLRQALELDPRYADVYVALAISFQQRYVDTNRTEYLDSSLAYARHALEIDPSTQRAYFTMARVYATQNDARWKDAFRRGIVLSPNTRDALSAAAGLARLEGRYDESLRYAKQLVAIEPTRAQNYAVVGGDNYLRLGLYEEARTWLERALQMQSDLWPAHAWSVHLYLALGRIDLAEQHAQSLLGLGLGGNRATEWAVRVLMWKGDFRRALDYVENSTFDKSFARAYVYMKLGERTKAEKALAECEAEQRALMARGGVPTVELAAVEFLRGNKEKGYTVLAQTIEAGIWQSDSDDAFVFQELYFPYLKQESRFQRLIEPFNQKMAAMRQRVRAEGL